MAINFQIRKQAIQSPNGKKTVFYAVPVTNGEATLEHLQKLVARISALSEGDVRSVIITLSQLIASELSAGRVVALGELGRMRISLRSKSASKGEDFKRSDITRVGVTFVPGALIREALQGAHLQRRVVSEVTEGIYVPNKEAKPDGAGADTPPADTDTAAGSGSLGL